MWRERGRSRRAAASRLRLRVLLCRFEQLRGFGVGPCPRRQRDARPGVHDTLALLREGTVLHLVRGAGTHDALVGSTAVLPTFIGQPRGPFSRSNASASSQELAGAEGEVGYRGTPYLLFYFTQAG